MNTDERKSENVATKELRVRRPNGVMGLTPIAGDFYPTHSLAVESGDTIRILLQDEHGEWVHVLDAAFPDDFVPAGHSNLVTRGEFVPADVFAIRSSLA